MKIVLLGTFPNSFPIFSYLMENVDLQAVFIVEEYHNKKIKNLLKSQFQENKIPSVFTPESNLNLEFKTFLINEKVDLVVVNTCAIKIIPEVLELPKYGFLNIHPGKFPKNRGADPIFWTIKNQEKSTAITVHKMDSNFDTGPILVEQDIPVHFGETSGMLNSKISLMSVDVLKKAISLIKDSNNYKLQIDIELYQNKPNQTDLSIDWENQTSDEIECLINACNPKYDGAITYYQGGEIKILEASPVDNPTPMFGKTPGEVLHAHPQEGIYVCCKYGQLLRINIIKSDAGILTGSKYANIGIQTGHCFTTQQFVKQSINT